MEINKKQWEYLQRVHERQKLSHAYLFAGPEGVGKLSTAFDFACLINEIKSKDLVRQGGHPDVVIVRPEIEEKNKKKRKKDISIEQIKNAMERVSFYPYQSRFKLVIIAEAERLTSAAANSLLKFLEEPQQDTIICLTAHNEDQVIPTIRSRCQPLRFGLHERETVEHFLRHKFPERQEEEISSCVDLAHGRVKFAWRFCRDQELREGFEQSRELFRKALRGGVIEGFALSESLHNDRFALIRSMDEWIWFLREFLRKNIMEGSDERVIAKVHNILGYLIELKAHIKNENVNSRIQLDNFFVQLS